MKLCLKASLLNIRYITLYNPDLAKNVVKKIIRVQMNFAVCMSTATEGEGAEV
jgi:hypothetical protein